MLTGLREPYSIKNSDAIMREQYKSYALLAKHRLNDNYEYCSFWKSEDGVIPKSFTLSVIAVENYGRPRLRRWLEELIAGANLQFSGKIPDYSFGIGQIRMSTARLLIQQRTTKKSLVVYEDRKLLKLILDPCESISLVSEYLSLLIRQSGFDHLNRESAFIILRKYNGQQESDQQSQFYQEVVWQTFLVYKDFLRD